MPLFLTEMWERLSYYGMRALLVLYLVQALHKSDKEAGEIYALYTSFIYLTPVLGGYITERWLGYKTAIYFGSVLMMCGHFCLGIQGESFFYLGLLFLVVGNGFFKPNISTVFGRLYKNTPSLKDSGYTIFYMGINLGGLLGPIICGYLGEIIDWHLGFFAAGVGMAIGILIFYLGAKKIPSEVWHLTSNGLENKNTLDSVDTEKNGNERVFLILLLSFFSIFFWMSFEQMGSSLNLFALRNTDRTIFGFDVPASLLQSVNPLFILLFGPLVSTLWTSLAIRGKNPNPILKFVISLILLGVGFSVMVVAAKLAEGGALVSIWFLVFVYFWNTISELCLSPVGLSFVSKTAPVRKTSLLMGIWFLSTAVGHYFAGIMLGFQSKLGSLENFYLFFVLVSFSAAFVLFFIYIANKARIQRIIV